MQSFSGNKYPLFAKNYRKNNQGRLELWFGGALIQPKRLRILIESIEFLKNHF